MTKTSLAAGLVLAMIGTAEAGGQEGSIGAGAEYGLRFTGNASGLGLASVNYDAGAFHVGGMLGFSDGGNDDDTDYSIGGRFYYHLHATAMADFSVGGTIGLVSTDTRGMPMTERDNDIYLEPGIQMRIFLVSNVAFSLSTGIALGLVDAQGFTIGGQVNGSAGVHYYFF